MSRWFRHYAGMMRDEKLVRVAVRSKQTVERVVWVWGAILESAAEINDGGRYEFDTGEAAYFLRCDEDELVRVVCGLEDSGRISGGGVVRWSDRQFDSDSAKERQRRYRERRKAGSDVLERHDNVGEASQSVTRDVTVTSRDGAVTLQETETDTKISDASASDGPVDFREKVWSEGVASIARMTGKTPSAAKAMVGKWLRETRDDCRLVFEKIRQAETERIGEPVAWITAAVRPPPKPKSIGEMFREDARQMGIIPNDQPTSTPDRRLVESDGSRQGGSPGITRRFAIPADVFGGIGQG